jgi:putative FmdB family regulatory protein
MPLYEYECEACGQRFEKIRKFSDKPLEKCQLCGKGPIHKLLSAPAIQFKGTGWYVTDYAGKNSDGSAKQDGGKAETRDKEEKREKADRAEKTGKAEKAEKAEKGDAGEKTAAKPEKPAAAPAAATTTTDKK